MENLRAVRLLMITAALSAVLLLGAPGALAYNNVGAHPTINQYAYQVFVNQYMPADQYLRMASLDGENVLGTAWDPQDGGSWHQRITEPVRTKPVEQWLSDAGFSADEPEIDMALKHFYDPVRTPHYLTDWINDLPGGDGYVNPHEDIYTWGFADNDNPYGFGNGEMYYKAALADTDPDTINYGKAWRSVGETMHLISDMTVPAHVRNDAHVPYLGYWDPFEYFTTASDVDTWAMLGRPTSALNYHAAYSSNPDIRTLFQNVATWTNQHFYSRDTVPVYGSTTSSNGEPTYPSPTITWDPSFTGYITATVDGRTVNMTRQSLAGLLWKEPYLVVDQNVCNDQRSIQIPTAIGASAAVLDAFLPRFQVSIDSVQPDPDYKGYYRVTAHIRHIATREWPDDLTIRNGAHIVIGSDDYIITPGDNEASSDNLNRLEFSVEIPAGSSYLIYYDLGGYEIKSPVYRLDQVSPTPMPTPRLTPTPTVTGQPTGDDTYGYPTNWLNSRYHPNYISSYQIWYYSDGNLLDDSFMVNYYSDGTTLSAVDYYGTGGVIKWYKRWDSYGTLTKYVVYDNNGVMHVIVDTGGNDDSEEGSPLDANPVLPNM